MQVTAHKHLIQSGDEQMKSDVVQNKHMHVCNTWNSYAFNTRINSPGVSEDAVGVGGSAEVDVVEGMVPEGTTSDVTASACAKSIVTH